jgi:hypothetical protein
MKLWGLEQKGTSRWRLTEMGRRLMASPEDYGDLWTSYLGAGWKLGLSDSYLFAQQNY